MTLRAADDGVDEGPLVFAREINGLIDGGVLGDTGFEELVKSYPQ